MIYFYSGYGPVNPENVLQDGEFDLMLSYFMSRKKLDKRFKALYKKRKRNNKVKRLLKKLRKDSK